jgi:NAD(P)-dependent dehydrogenase (short-subunit alcohol dehydrogenase family)
MTGLANQLGLEGRVVIVTGAAGGLGRAFADGFAAAGAKVVVADIALERVEATAAAIRARLGTALAVQVDVTNAASLEALAARTLQTFAAIDVLVNNAAVYAGIVRKPFTEIDEADWDRIMAVNVIAAVVALCRVQGRHHRDDAGHGAGAGRPGHPGQCAGSWLYTDRCQPGPHLWRRHLRGRPWCAEAGLAAPRCGRRSTLSGVAPRRLCHRPDACRGRRSAVRVKMWAGQGRTSFVSILTVASQHPEWSKKSKRLHLQGRHRMKGSVDDWLRVFSVPI